MKLLCDFHMHSNNSDGEKSVSKLVDILYSKSLKFATLTDHDTILGCNKFNSLCKEKNIKSKTALEISCFHENETIHILTYFIDNSYNNNLFKDFLINIQKSRLNRIEKILDLLYINFKIKLNRDFLNSTASITRLHLANEIKSQGYDLNFETMLSNKSPCYLPSVRFPFIDTINLLNNLNCIKIIAHPILIKNTNINFFTKYVDGFEAYHPAQDIKFSNKIVYLCNRFNKLITVGSDFHNFNDSMKHGHIGETKFNENELYPFIEKLFS